MRVRDSAIAFTRFCLPQVFFYGMYVLVGQILNARGSFGPMMWAPIANNVIAVAVVLVYIVGYGKAEGAEVFGGYGSGQELLLGLGSTLGIAVQLLILVPYLRRSGFVYTPAARPARQRARAHAAAGRVDRALRDRQPGRLRRRPAARDRRRGGRRDGTGFTVYSNFVPGRDGPALDRHRLARDRDAAAALRARRRPVTGRRSPARWRARCARRWR